MPTYPSDIHATLEMLERYPWYAYTALRGLDQSDSQEHRRRLADILGMCVGDPAILAALLGEEDAPEAPPTPSGAAVPADSIDAFISRYGSASAQLPPDVARLQQLPPADGGSDGRPTAPDPSDVRRLIKKGDYEAAIEIIKELNLNNPEKSIYFADQIRFLKKLIINRSKAGAGK